MSINWVMLHDRDGFVRLPDEQVLYTSPPRTGLSLQTPHTYTGSDRISIQTSSGCVYLTNQRVIYIPVEATENFQSFSSPLLNLYDTHISAPFFGPNVWVALVHPVPGGGISASLQAAQLKITFKEGGAFDFHTNFERIKERLRDAIENSNRGGGGGARALNMVSVHLDELPAYEGPRIDPASPPISTSEQRPHETSVEPSEPPPGYEEAQQQNTARGLEDGLRKSD